jgi:uncharacterized protein
VIGAIMERYNEIVHQFADDAFHPILWRFAETGTVIASNWAYGFAQAIALRPRRWTRMVKSEAGLLFVPIMVCEADEILDVLELSAEEVGQTVDEAIEILPATVIAIADYWRMAASQRHRLTAGLRTATRIGRNDPCPCGSGDKFKRCCGARP